MRILISGGLGFVGSHLVRRLSKSNEIALIVRDSSQVNSQFELFEIINYNSTMQERVSIFNPDIFIHLAAKYIREHSFEDIDNILGSNVKLGVLIFESLRYTKCRKVINVGSTLQFYNSDEKVVNNLYAASKNAFEEFIKYYVNELDFRVLNLYLSDTYGESDNRGKIVDYIMEMIIKNNELRLTKSEQLISLTHIDDVIDGFENAIRTIDESTMNYLSYFLCNPSLYSLKDIVELIVKITKKDIKVNYGYHNYRSNEVFNPFIGKILPGWNPKIDLLTGLMRHFNYKNNILK
jgi:nucleoside-diphosphate-sugar epimerase